MTVMAKKSCNGKVVSVEKLHELASDEQIQHIFLNKETIRGEEIGQADNREFSKWNLRFAEGFSIYVYV